ncbi:MAG: hypothetical protein HOD85_16115 [Deltaproteobacteria bacterium]|nr:hypothetical protein [Deltaproteobacteria bacterium]MBT4265722.1 hypothetical protein [Deltaproteobacteria bacterium]MBT4639525.1 hypothetical protein [Deltaproteobacteria bacterium]
MKILLIILSLGLLFFVNANASDIGHRIHNASAASLSNQFMVMPLPMSHYLEEKYQWGISGGYTEIDADVVTLSGELFSVSYSQALKKGWGLYGIGYYTSQKVKGGGMDELITDFLPRGTETPVELNGATRGGKDSIEVSNVQGKVAYLGVGIGVVWDPIVKNEQSNSMPLMAGIIFNQYKMDNTKVDWRLTQGSDINKKGTLDYSATYNHFLPFVGWQFAMNLGSDFRMIPSMFFAMTLKSEGQKVKWTGTSSNASTSYGGDAFEINGDTDSAGNKEANIKLFIIAPGFTIVYRPWGLSTNIGATFADMVVPGLGVDDVEKVLVYNITFQWPKYE